MEETVDQDGNYPASTYQSMANMIDWFLKAEAFALELVINAIAEMRTNIKDFASILWDADFLQFTSRFEDFIDNHVDLIDELSGADLGL